MRKYFRENFFGWLFVVFFIAWVVLMVFQTYFPDAGIYGDLLLVIAILLVVLGGTFIHRFF